MVDALRQRGEEHEQVYVASLRAEGLRIVEIPTGPKHDIAVRATATLQAMHDGADVIVQAALTNDGWTGYADILRRVNTPSALGGWSYEPCDTKLARETRGGTILQLAVYVDLLAQLQGLRPDRFHVVTPGVSDKVPFAVHTYRFADYAAYFGMVRRQLADTLSRGHDAIRAGHYPEPVEHCDVCHWWERCNQQRRADDHLSFIANIGRLHREELTAQGYPTLAAAAAMVLPVAFKPTRGSRDTYTRIGEQARVQFRQRTTKQPVHELLPIVEGQGLARLPEPSPGDIFLDLEGARFAREGGREYLFGVWTRDGAYECDWAFDDIQERAAFEALIDRVIAAWDADPGMHIYHFGHYEPTALKRLMGRYATRAAELDRLLRGGRFVDLFTVVRQALRAGVESYSIKQLEQFYSFTRDVSLKDASAHLQSIELALEGHAPGVIADDVREMVRGYNQDDCRSTEALRDWLERLRADVCAAGTEVPRPEVQDDKPNEKVREMEARQQAARARLLDGLPPEAANPDHAQHPYWLLAYLIDWHRREDNPQYWERFRLAELSDDELLEERQALAGLEHVERVEESRFKNGNVKSVVDRYRYPAQEVELGRKGELRMSGGAIIGSIADHDRAGRTIDIKKGRGTPAVHPTAVFQAVVYSTDVQQQALLRFSEAPDAHTCGTDLLFRRPPRVSGGEFRPCGNDSSAAASAKAESTSELAVRLATQLDRTTLAVQGPPGAGKTYAGAQMILALVRAGKKVGVTAVSHKVIRNLLDAVAREDQASPVAAGLQTGRTSTLRLGHKCDPDEEGNSAGTRGIREIADNAEALGAVASGDVNVLGGTSWLWSHEDAVGRVDVLFVDEAGQMSLANALAVSGAANSLVLLGDPQQLDQPQKGTHPDGVGVSALDHVLGGARTMPSDRGLFLPTTWRLHPAICAFTSEAFYEGKLESKPGLKNQRLAGTGEFDGAGLWWVPVEHDGNQNYSPEEVDTVARLVDQFLAPGAMWVDEDGASKPLTAADVLVVSPFNAQVNRLSERLAGRDVRVGTVDKFQGQEAPIVIYSMATSRPEDAPRGMEFLYSLNRLNVATSRARCAAIVVASPQLCEPVCRTPRQMLLANALCRYREFAVERGCRTLNLR